MWLLTNLFIKMLDKWDRDKAGFTPDRRSPRGSVPADHDSTIERTELSVRTTVPD